MLTDIETTGMRVVSESAMPDTVAVSRPVEGGTLDPATGVWTPATPTAIYSGKGRVRVMQPTPIEVIHGDTEVAQQRYVLTIPYSAALPKVDDRVEVTTSSDPEIDQRHFRVSSVGAGSYAIDRRCTLEVIE